jgi:hypothetical protein
MSFNFLNNTSTIPPKYEPTPEMENTPIKKKISKHDIPPPPTKKVLKKPPQDFSKDIFKVDIKDPVEANQLLALFKKSLLKPAHQVPIEIVYINYDSKFCSGKVTQLDEPDSFLDYSEGVQWIEECRKDWSDQITTPFSKGYSTIRFKPGFLKDEDFKKIKAGDTVIIDFWTGFYAGYRGKAGFFYKINRVD